MTWARLDDTLPTHPKIAGLSDAAFRLYVTAICYCAQHLTDGVVVVAALHRSRPGTIRELLAARLLEKTERGIEVHGYLDCQPTRAYVLELRKKRAEAGAKGGKASGEARGEAPAGAKDEALAPVDAEQNASNPGSEISNHILSSPLRDKKEEKERGASRPSRSGFSPPSLEEVRREVAGQAFTFSAERFHAVNEAKGWAGVRNWRAACRAWQALESTGTGNPKIKSLADVRTVLHVHKYQADLDREAEAEQIARNRAARPEPKDEYGEYLEEKYRREGRDIPKLPAVLSEADGES